MAIQWLEPDFGPEDDVPPYLKARIGWEPAPGRGRVDHTGEVDRDGLAINAGQTGSRKVFAAALHDEAPEVDPLAATMDRYAAERVASTFEGLNGGRDPRVERNNDSHFGRPCGG